jgi:hypothetical protein
VELQWQRGIWTQHVVRSEGGVDGMEDILVRWLKTSRVFL